MSNYIVVLEALGEHGTIRGSRTWMPYESADVFHRLELTDHKVLAEGITQQEAINLCAENAGTTMARALVADILAEREIRTRISKAMYAIDQFGKEDQFNTELLRIVRELNRILAAALTE